MTSTSRSHRLVRTTFVINVVLLAGFVVVYLGSRSQLVLAQGADSLLDLAAGAVLLISTRVGMQPGDENHHFGHHRAEPIGALVTAILVGVLAFEVGKSAVMALVTGAEASFDLPVFAVLGGKFLIKAVWIVYLTRHGARASGAALHATWVDTRNDVLATGSSLAGVFLARTGSQWADPVLALPIALYILISGIELARENLRFLMGEAPSADVQREIEAAAAHVEGVIEVSEVRAHYVGSVLHTEVAVVLGEHLSATQAHDLAVEVQHGVEQHPLVGRAFVHVDTDATRPDQPPK